MGSCGEERTSLNRNEGDEARHRWHTCAGAWLVDAVRLVQKSHRHQSCQWLDELVYTT